MALETWMVEKKKKKAPFVSWNGVASCMDSEKNETRLLAQCTSAMKDSFNLSKKKQITCAQTEC